MYPLTPLVFKGVPPLVWLKMEGARKGRNRLTQMHRDGLLRFDCQKLRHSVIRDLSSVFFHPYLQYCPGAALMWLVFVGLLRYRNALTDDCNQKVGNLCMHQEPIFGDIRLSIDFRFTFSLTPFSYMSFLPETDKRLHWLFSRSRTSKVGAAGELFTYFKAPFTYFFTLGKHFI